VSARPPLRVVLIGPECTGKTRLAEGLSARYGVPWSAEYAREYVEHNPRPLDYQDVEPIGRGQKAGEDAAIAAAAARGSRLVFLDTDLLSTAVYSRHYFGDCPGWIERQARERRAELYLLHHVDVAWEEDGLQREQPERRAELLERFRTALLDLEARAVDVLGSWEQRRERAVDGVERLLAEAVSGDGGSG
jgi:NadR type nicotinamide-nucleotide adenylyltransferase